MANDGSYWLRPSLHLQLHDRNTAELAYPVALGGTLMFRSGSDARLRPRSTCPGIASSSGWADSVWWEPPSTTGPVALASCGGRASRRLGRPEGLHRRQPSARAAFLGVGLTAAADDAQSQGSLRCVRSRGRDVDPEYAPETVNTDGWASTRNAFQKLFPLITVVLCFLARVLEDSRPLPQGPRTAPPGVGRLPCRHCGGVFRRLMNAFQQWSCNANLDRLGARDA